MGVRENQGRPMSDWKEAADKRELRKAWRSEAVLGVIVTGLVYGAISTHGLIRVVLAVPAVVLGLLLVWSVTILFGVRFLLSILGRLAREGRPPWDR